MESSRDRIIAKYHTHLNRDDRAAEFTYRSFHRTVEPWLPESRDAAILDVGCGEGTLLRFLRDQGYVNLSAFDLSQENVELCQSRGFSFVRLHDATKIRAFEGTALKWDLIICLDLLEHLTQGEAFNFLTDVRDLLAPDGAVVIQTPNMAYICANVILYGDLTHETGYTEMSIRSLFSATGYSRLDIRPHWYATTLAGRLREALLRVRHWWHYLPEGSIAPRIPAKNLLVRARM
jgi:2-polyprenyl-3-methyl-5-hydroxy-6-metoxy-1,4-benzoquinol methylase